jgi:tRNA pseudouridine13 synthase
MQPIFNFKSIPADFRVREVPLLPQVCDPTEFTPTYTYIWLEKVGYTTFEAQRALQEFFHLLPPQVSAQGLKDEDGITLQLIAVGYLVNEQRISDFNDQFQGSNTYLKIQGIWGYGQRPFTPGALHGNTFTITLRNIQADIAEELTWSYSSNHHFSFVNYYDTQRFGLPGGPYNAHLIGEAIVHDDWQKAMEEFARTRNLTVGLAAHLPEHTSREACREFFHHVDVKLIAFFVSSYSSQLWNQQASIQLQTLPAFKIKALPEPDLGELLIPTTMEAELPALVSTHAFHWDNREGKATAICKTRPLIVSTSVYCSSPEPDELNPPQTKLGLSFFLPTGCYATMLLKQLSAQFQPKGQG